jgi:hypothetical protein
MMYELFFSTDIMRLAGRAIDVSAVDDDNPTLFNAKCTVCHDNIDAWAGAFRHWDGGGRYRPETVWHTDMVPTAFAGEALPSDARENPLGWLAGKIIDDERFAMSVVHTIYEGLTGTAPLAQPIDALSETYLADARAYDAQDYMLMHIAQGFRESGQDVRVVVKELIKSPWFRASGAAGSLTDEQRAELAGIGTARMLAPEILLLNSGAYRLLYGGIDPTQLVTERLTGMNGMIASIAERMANDVSCTTVAVDFAKPQAERLLFGDVEITDQPEDDRVAIAASLRHLHERLWGESLEWGDPDLDRALTLFTEVWLDGRAGIEAGEYPLALPGRCQAHQDPLTGQAFAAPIVEDPDYTVRAWMVVVSYMLGDFRYLYE